MASASVVVYYVSSTVSSEVNKWCNCIHTLHTICCILGRQQLLTVIFLGNEVLWYSVMLPHRLQVNEVGRRCIYAFDVHFVCMYKYIVVSVA